MRGLSYAKAAQTLGLSNAMVAWRYCRGTIPRTATIQRIYQLTDGAVGAWDWHFPRVAGHHAERQTNKPRDPRPVDEVRGAASFCFRRKERPLNRGGGASLEIFDGGPRRDAS
jgi:hypothetical protein